MDTQININYAEIIGNREIQLEALRTVLRQKNEHIRELEQRIDRLLEQHENEAEAADD